MKKVLALALVAVMMMALCGVAFAQEKASGMGGSATVTVANASKGETYRIVKLFDAVVTGTAGGPVSYTGTIPADLTDLFEKDSAGNITAKRIADSAGRNPGETGYEDTFKSFTATDFADIKTWAEGVSDGSTDYPSVSETSDGSALTFTGLKYGYYVVTSTQGANVTVNSTNPDVTIYDKNTKTVSGSKTVEKETYSIGDTINYTATFDTTNYKGTGSSSQQVIDYVISDTLPEFLSDVVVDSIIVDEDADLDTTSDQTDVTAQFTNKAITIDWATEVTPATDPRTWVSNYANGSKIVMKYHATLTSVTNINTADTNTVKIIAHVADDEGNPEPWDDNWEYDAVIKTYAAALKKTDGTNPLPGAQFTIKGLVVSGSAGEYTVVSYDPSDSAAESAVLDTDADGKLYILGLASDVSLTVTEYKAPDGYNKLTAPQTVTPQLLTTKIYKASGTIKYDAKGNVIESTATASTTETVNKNLTDLDTNAVEVVNNAGTELPSTGGIGTTIFYVAGLIMVLGAATILIARRKADAE